MPKDQLLEVVDEGDMAIGQTTRGKIHEDGLLHREIHVWFATPEGQIIFQRRAADKDTYPNLLDSTVGGHVDPGMTYDQTAVKEMEEETGVRASPSDLHFLKKLKTRTADQATHTLNHVFRAQYAYIFRGQISDLRVETGKAAGFEGWPIDKLLSISEDEKKRFIPVYFSPEILSIFREIQKLLKAV
ncbi:MAG: hypothetical protein QOG91_675 [Candidatus Parcubacteria bacterium]|jgi:isopentenyldiphosphate isomerase|nr:hypothetical protein [Candidatus Parcubacteria bacterium]